MQKSIYTPLSAAIAHERAMNVIANNLANLKTNGFKGENVTFKLLEPEPNKYYRQPLPPANYKFAFEDFIPLKGNEVSYVGVSGIFKDLSQGPALTTNNPLDLMIEKNGYFTVQTPEGIRYTRSGNFRANGEGILVTPNGHPVLGERGTIVLRNSDIEINHHGEVFQDKELIDKLLLHDFDDRQLLARTGNNYLIYDGPESGVKRLSDGSVLQGFLEGSNVNAVKNLTAMILAHRSYEASQKALKNYDQMMEKSSNRLGGLQA